MRFTRYVEKPSRPFAEQLTRQGAYWSAGIFIGHATTFLELAQRWLPRHAQQIMPLGVCSAKTFAARAKAAYARLPSVSFDEGVMAHLRRGIVIEGTFTWEDLGSWDSWVKVSALARPGVAIGGRNVRVVNADGHLIATVGLDDVVIVRTADATLICRADHAQTVKTLTTKLAQDTRLAKWL
jgi:mannose-1-phosphate guanylyltransferase